MPLVLQLIQSAGLGSTGFVVGVFEKRHLIRAELPGADIFHFKKGTLHDRCVTFQVTEYAFFDRWLVQASMAYFDLTWNPLRIIAQGATLVLATISAMGAAWAFTMLFWLTVARVVFWLVRLPANRG